jgi:hypothetical protein
VGSALAVIALSVTLAGWVVAAGSDEPSKSAVAPAKAPAPRSLPLAGNPQALMLATRSRDFLAGLAATPGGPVDILVFPGRGSVPADGLTANANGRPATLSSCGERCFRVSAAPMTGTPLLLSLRFRRTSGPSVTVRFRLPARLPPDGGAVFRKANRRMRALRSVQYDEWLTSGLSSGVRTHYAMRAPDRLRFRTSQGQTAILIGRRRWDREGTRWVESPFPGVRVPAYVWEGARNARLLGRARLAGVPVRVLAAFSNESIPAWFRIFVAADGRVLEAEMLSESHFMRHRFSGLNEPVRIEAPA